MITEITNEGGAQLLYLWHDRVSLFIYFTAYLGTSHYPSWWMDTATYFCSVDVVAGAMILISNG